jgi:DinB superfamily
MVPLELMKEKLAETRMKLLNEITSLNYEEFNTVPEENIWSVAQVCHHLYLVEISFAKAILYGLTKEDAKKAEPKQIQLLSDRSKKIIAPEMVIPREEPFEKQQLVDMLDESRAMMLDVMNKVHEPSILVERSVKHPVFGYLPLYQWIETTYLHEDRHIEQIREIKMQIL